MKKRLLPAIIGLAIATTLCATDAWASTTSSSTPALQQNALTLRLGALFPSAETAKDFGGSTQFGIGLDYTLNATSGVNPGATNAYFDYLTGSHGSGYIHSGGIGLAYRTIGQTYFGAGVGVYNTSVHSTITDDSASRTGAGGRVFAGFGLGDRASLELDYHVVPAALGANPSGLGLQIGIRL